MSSDRLPTLYWAGTTLVVGTDATCPKRACPIAFHTDTLSLPADRSESGIHRLALECQHPEHAFMHAIEGFAIDETMQRFVAEHKLAKRQVALGCESAMAQASQIRRLGVRRPVDDSQVLAAATFDGRLQ